MTGSNAKVLEGQVTAEKVPDREMLLVCSIATEAAVRDLLCSACESQLILHDPHALASILFAFSVQISENQGYFHVLLRS